MSEKTILAILASVAVASSFAQDAAEGEPAVPPAKTAAAAPAKSFTTLPLCRQVEGVVEMRRAGAEAWEPVEEGRFIPLGSSFRTAKDGRLVLAFGPECSATITGDSEIGTRSQGLSDVARTVVLRYGSLELDLARNLPEGAFFVSLPSFVVKNPAGESRYSLERLVDGNQVKIRCVTGALGVQGLHFNVASMHAADEMWVRSSEDRLCTFLYGKSGDYVVDIEAGVVEKTTIDDNGQPVKVSEKSKIKWALSPETKVRIDRKVPEIGKRMAVNVFTFDTTGKRKNWFNFTEDLAAVNSGELIPASVEEAEALAKRAAEATTDEKGDGGEADEKDKPEAEAATTEGDAEKKAEE